MIDNHLDCHGYYLEDYQEILAPFLQMYIALDNELVKLGENQVGHKQLAWARNNLESSLLCCAKAIALQHESNRERQSEKT